MSNKPETQCSQGDEVSMAKKQCRWTLEASPEYSIWETGCGDMFMFTEDGPSENDFRYCPFCGGVLKEDLPSEIPT